MERMIAVVIKKHLRHCNAQSELALQQAPTILGRMSLRATSLSGPPEGPPSSNFENHDVAFRTAPAASAIPIAAARHFPAAVAAPVARGSAHSGRGKTRS